jgi:hypothetical protein
MMSTDWWISEAVKDEPGERCAKLMLQTTELRAAVNALLCSCQRKPEYFQKVVEIMRRCQAMDQAFTQWEDTLPESWRPKTVAWVDNVPGGDLTKAEVYPGRVDLYDDNLIAASWNHMRISRLFVSGLVIRCAAWMCSPVDYRTTPEYAQGARLGVDIVTDILASVPYHLGWHIDEDGSLVDGDLSGNTGGLENGGTTALGGFLIMWPLFCVNSSDFTTDAQRKWVDGRMRIIHEVLGLNQAKVMGAVSIHLPLIYSNRQLLTDASSRCVFHPCPSGETTLVNLNPPENCWRNGQPMVQNLQMHPRIFLSLLQLSRRSALHIVPINLHKLPLGLMH